MKRTLTATTALVASIACLAAPALAEDIPWNDAEVDLVARNQPIQDFLRKLFKAEGLSVSFDAGVTGPVSGEFSGTAEEVFRMMAAGYDLVPYFDGSTVRIATGDSVDSAMYDLAPGVGEDVRRQLSDLDMGDTKNTTRITRDGVTVVSGVPSYRRAVDGVIRTRDTAKREPADAMVTKVFHLKYAWAQDTTSRFGSTEITVPGIATIMRAVASGNADGPAVHAQTQKQELGVQRLTEVAGGGGRRAAADHPYARRQDAALREAADFGSQVPPFAAEIQPLPNGMSIEADPRLNAIIIRDRAANMDGHRALITELDVEPKIVAIEATIVDVDTDRLRETGVQWRLGEDRFSATQGGPVTRGLPLNPGDFANPFAGGLLASGVIGGEDILTARVALLESEGLAKVVSRPQVMTLANVEAVFNNTRTFFPRVEGDFDASLFQVTFGTILSVTPHVIEEDGEELVKLLVSVEDGRLNPGVVDGLPVVERSGVGTQGVMRIGETLLFGGLTVDRSESFEEGVPVLSKVPVLGSLFKQKTRSSGRAERMFLLTPRLITPGANVAQRMDAPAPIIGQAAPDLYRRAAPVLPARPRPQPQPAPERQQEPRPLINEVSAPAAAAAGGAVATSLGLEVQLGVEAAPAPLLRGGQLFGGGCDDLDPFAACEDDA